MLSRERFITYSIIVLLLSALIYFVFLGDEEYVEDYNAKITALEAKVDSLHHINDDLIVKIDTLNDKILVLDNEIVNADNLIKTLRIKTNERIKAVDNFNDDELYQFFTERYFYAIDSIRKADSKTGN